MSTNLIGSMVYKYRNKDTKSVFVDPMDLAEQIKEDNETNMTFSLATTVVAST